MANAIIARGFQWTDLGTADPAGCLAAEQEWLARAEARVVVWESSQECAVLGVAGRPARDVAADVAVPVLRRHSGGGAIVLGAGCLNYGVIVPFDVAPECRDVRAGWRWVLERVCQALAVDGLRWEPPCDLALGGRKVSGNAQRRTRAALLHHGTLLYDFDARRAGEILRPPPRQPEYRAGRADAEFLGNLPLPAHELRHRLRAFWLQHPDAIMKQIERP